MAKTEIAIVTEIRDGELMPIPLLAAAVILQGTFAVVDGTGHGIASGDVVLQLLPARLRGGRQARGRQRPRHAESDSERGPARILRLHRQNDRRRLKTRGA